MNEAVTDLLEEVNREFGQLGLDCRPAIVRPGDAEPVADRPSVPRSIAFGLLVGLSTFLLLYLFCR